MATNAQIITENVEARAISLRWIINARDDMVWFIGSVVSSYLLLALYVAGILPLIPMIAAWAILIDAPHVFGTFSRTYFDRAERKTRKRLLLGSLAFFVVGPLMVFAGAGALFFFLAALWAYYHLVKQHYGFMVLYKKKNNDLAQIDNALDRVLLIFAFWYPFVLFIARDAEAMERVPAPLHAGVSFIATILLIGTIATALAWLARQIQRAMLGQPLDVPKYLLLAAAIPMHWVALLTPMPNKTIALVAILTVYHNLQYHRLIWFHNRKYKSSADCKERYGAAELISRRLLFYIVFGVLFGLWYQGPRQYVLGYLLNHHERENFWMQMMASFLWGYAFIHYYLDSKIWRVRRDPSVGRALQMN
ncbi:MAG: hypothetical protein AUG51_06695 [Acidobacteria bacterium 13_1_20CM_3_53_8]|nr:MAG: hypothetical protein AUG51_06695 [Acidobacteria bacterium 13_1_20CM_3_53_8]